MIQRTKKPTPKVEVVLPAMNSTTILRAYRWTFKIEGHDFFRPVHCKHYDISFVPGPEREGSDLLNLASGLICLFETEWLLFKKSGSPSLLKAIYEVIRQGEVLRGILTHYDGIGRSVEENLLHLRIKKANIRGDYKSADKLHLVLQCELLSMEDIDSKADGGLSNPQGSKSKSSRPKSPTNPRQSSKRKR